MKSTNHHIGVDEAGLGPNLGPLVIVATRWSGESAETDALWERYAAAVTREFDGRRLHIGDSKAVYKNKSDFSSLERSARAILAAAGIRAGRLVDLVAAVDPDVSFDGIPWLESDASAPEMSADGQLAELLSGCDSKLEVAAAFVPARRFNGELDAADTKGQALSRLSLRTLRRLWSPEDAPTAIWCDKHGGRNRYDDLLLEHSDGTFVVRHAEGRESSRYSVGESEIVFGVKSERHFPVACASIVAKYLRQRAMRAFNAWWTDRVPELKPTEGYPQDAKRFREDVAEARKELKIADEVFWRRK